MSVKDALENIEQHSTRHTVQRSDQRCPDTAVIENVRHVWVRCRKDTSEIVQVDVPDTRLEVPEASMPQYNTKLSEVVEFSSLSSRNPQINTAATAEVM
jgi:hypothetical protein